MQDCKGVRTLPFITEGGSYAFISDGQMSPNEAMFLLVWGKNAGRSCSQLFSATVMG